MTDIRYTTEIDQSGIKQGMGQVKATIAEESREAQNALAPIGVGVDDLGGKFSLLGTIAKGGMLAVAAAAVSIAGTMADNASAVEHLNLVLKATGETSGQTSAQIEAFARSMEGASGLSRAAIIGIAAELVELRGIAGSVREDAVRLGEDMATVFGGDAATQAKVLGGVLNDLAEGDVKSLNRNFEFLGDTTLELIERTRQSEGAFAAQKKLIEELDEAVGGASAEDQKGLAGAMKRAYAGTVSLFEYLAQKTGLTSALATGFNTLADAVNFFADGAARPADPGLSQMDRWMRDLQPFWNDMDASRAANQAALDASAAAAEKRAKAASDRRRREQEAEARAQARREQSFEQHLQREELEAGLVKATREEREAQLAIYDAQVRLGRDLTDIERQRLDMAVRAQAAEKQADEDRRQFARDWEQAQAAARREFEKQTHEAERQFESLSDTFYDLFTGQGRSFWGNWKDAGLKAISAVAAQFVLNPSGGLGGAVATLGQSNLLSGSPLQGLFGLFGGAGQSGAGAPGINGGTFTFGNPKFDILTGGGFGGGSGLPQHPGTSTLPSTLGQGMDFGGMLSVGVGSMLGGAVGGGTAGQIGGGLGSIAGYAIGGPIGALVGGLLGGLVGGLFKKTPKSSAAVTVDNGDFGVGAVSGSSTQRKQAATTLASGVGDALSRLAEALDLDPGGPLAVSIGTRKSRYVVDPTGRGATKAKNGALSFATEEDALAFAIRDAIKDGVLEGLTEAEKKALTGPGDLEKAADAVARARQAKRDLAALNDPVAAAIEELQRDFDKTARLYKQFGLDISDEAELANRRRKQIIEDGVEQELSGLRDVIRKLTVGDLAGQSLSEQFAAAQQAYEAARAGTDNAALTEAADRLASLNAEMNATSRDRFILQEQIVADLREREATTQARFDALSATDIGASVGAALADPLTAIRDASIAGAELVAGQVQDLSAVIAALTSRLGGTGQVFDIRALVPLAAL